MKLCIGVGKFLKIENVIWCCNLSGDDITVWTLQNRALHHSGWMHTLQGGNPRHLNKPRI